MNIILSNFIENLDSFRDVIRKRQKEELLKESKDVVARLAGLSSWERSIAKQTNATFREKITHTTFLCSFE